jgi:hypothetical protein
MTTNGLLKGNTINEIKQRTMKSILSIFALILTAQMLSAQCASWIDSPKKEEAENAHVVYRQYIKSKDYDGAFTQWKIAFGHAPAADGKRDWHFKDGIAIYKHKFEKATDATEKAEYKDKVIELYSTAAECYANKAITFPNCNDEKCINQKIGYLKGRQAYDMYYTFLTPRSQTLKVLDESIKLSGNSTEYIVLSPYADIVVYLFSNEKMTKEEARAAHKMLMDIADYNIENNQKFSDYYAQTKASMEGSFAKIENFIFDCDYFVDKLQPDYEADPQDPANLEEIIKQLKRRGCDDSEPFLARIEAEYATIAAAYNAAQQAEFEANNPSIVAKKLYDAGDFQGACDKYKSAIAMEEDSEKRANYYFSLASIQGRKMNAYSQARASAYKAAEEKKGWGRPYMLIGDMYAKSSSRCGDDAYTRGLAVIAAIDKWAHARNIDSSVADDANRNIAKFSQYLPPKDEAFMMGKKEGQTAKVGCWIGETVKLKFN